MQTYWLFQWTASFSLSRILHYLTVSTIWSCVIWSTWAVHLLHIRTEVLSISSLIAEWGWWLLPGYGFHYSCAPILFQKLKSNFHALELQLFWNPTIWHFPISQLLVNNFVDHQLQQIKFHSHTTKFIPSWIKVSISTALFIVIDKCGHSTKGLYLLCQTNTCIFYVHYTQVQGEFLLDFLSSDYFSCLYPLFYGGRHLYCDVIYTNAFNIKTVLTVTRIIAYPYPVALC